MRPRHSQRLENGLRGGPRTLSQTGPPSTVARVELEVYHVWREPGTGNARPRDLIASCLLTRSYVRHCSPSTDLATSNAERGRPIASAFARIRCRWSESVTK